MKNMIETEHRVRILLSDITEDTKILSTYMISDIEISAIDNNFEKTEWWDSKLINYGSMDDLFELCEKITDKNTNTRFMASIGTIYPYSEPHFFIMLQ